MKFRTLPLQDLLRAWRTSADASQVANCFTVLSQSLRQAREKQDKNRLRRVLKIANFFLSHEIECLHQEPRPGFQKIKIEVLVSRSRNQPNLFEEACLVFEAKLASNQANRGGSLGVAGSTDDSPVQLASRLCGRSVEYGNEFLKTAQGDGVEAQKEALDSMLRGIESAIKKLASPQGQPDHLVVVMHMLCAGCVWLSKLCYERAKMRMGLPPPYTENVLEVIIRYHRKRSEVPLRSCKSQSGLEV